MKALQIFIILGYIRIVAYSTLANFAYFFHPWITGNVWSFDRKGVKSNVIFHRIDFQLYRQFKL
jgi:hypothetical protein